MLSIQARQNNDEVQILAKFTTISQIEIRDASPCNGFCRFYIRVRGSTHKVVDVYTQDLNSLRRIRNTGRDSEFFKGATIFGEFKTADNKVEHDIAQFIELLRHIESELLPYVQELQASIKNAEREHNERKQKAQNLTNLINTLLANQVEQNSENALDPLRHILHQMDNLNIEELTELNKRVASELHQRIALSQF